MPPRLSLTLCGPTTAHLDGAPLAGASLGAKPLALLAFLALEPRAHAREALMALLWGDFPEAQARASLRQALAQLHRVLGDALRLERGTVALEAEVALDVAPLLPGANGHGHPHVALVLDPGAFLTGLRIRNGGGFEEWADGVRAQLRRRQATLLAAATRDAIARLDWDDAVRLADRWRAAAPMDADATQAAMEAHHLAGRTGEALALYAEYRAALAADVGEAPPAPVRTLAQRLARATVNEPTPTPAHGVPAIDRMALAVPLVGRTREWEALAAAWRASRDGAGTVVVMSGEVGAGKTRLVGDFARRVAADGGTVLHARAREAQATIPFAAAGELLRSALDAPGFAATDGEWLAEVARLVPEVRTRLPGVPVAARGTLAEEWRPYEGAAQLVATLAAEQPLWILLDDAQWCDAATAALVRFLVERAERLPVAWCIVVSTGTAPRDEPGVRMASALAAAPGATTIDVDPFTVTDVQALLAAAGRMRDDAAMRRLAARLQVVTGGLPAPLVRALPLLRMAGVIVDDADGAWRVARPLPEGDEPGAALDTAALTASIAERIARLGDDAQAVLLTLALAREACAPDLLSRVHGVSRLRAAAIGDALVERGLAREEDSRYRVASLLVAAVVRRQGSSARRTEVTRALASARAEERAGMPRAAGLPAPTGEWRVNV